ncbi:MAG: NADP oxidoreductase [Deltaproteobacteria bacterium]|nr:MAG: NADP oxidoreductase [Deltaproteobacteria bacterium]
MKIAILGTGVVGKTLAGKLASLGHDVALGTRDPDATLTRTAPGPFGDLPVAALVKDHPTIQVLTFADAAAHGELAILATGGQVTLAAAAATGSALDGKILMDLSNPLDFSKGFPPTLSVCNDDSLGEQVQRALPAAKVVKTLNTVNVSVMIAPEALPGGAEAHTLFVCGDDPDAKARVTGLLREWFGWRDVLDLGDITTARGTEMYLPLWLRMMGAVGKPAFNIKVVR